MFLNKYAQSFLSLTIVFFLWSCSEDKSTSPNDSTELSSSSSLDDEIGLSSSNKELGNISSSSSSKKDDITSSSSKKGSEISSSSANKPKESSSSKKDDITSSSSKKGSEISSSSADKSKESSSSKKDDVVSSSSNKESEVSSSSLDEPKESSSSKKDDVESSSSSYFKSSWINLNESVLYDTIIDSRDNQVYKILTIGEQTWMAENLNYYDTIETPELKQHSWCFKNKESNCELYGRLYDLSVTIGYDTSKTTIGKLMQMEMDSNNVQGICPDRFRVPTISDYKKLTDVYNKAGDLITERENVSGFSIPVNGNTGFRNASQFVDKDVRLWSTTYHWSASDYADAIDFKLSSYTYDIGSHQSFGCNIRCVKK